MKKRVIIRKPKRNSVHSGGSKTNLQDSHLLYLTCPKKQQLFNFGVSKNCYRSFWKILPKGIEEGRCPTWIKSCHFFFDQGRMDWGGEARAGGPQAENAWTAWTKSVFCSCVFFVLWFWFLSCENTPIFCDCFIFSCSATLSLLSFLFPLTPTYSNWSYSLHEKPT